MKTRSTRAGGAILAALALAACQDSDPTAPADREESFTFEEELALQTIADEGSIDVALDVATSFATARGAPRARATDVAAARSRFAAARAALAAGERRRALDEALEARLLVARALEAGGGRGAVEAMVERLEHLASVMPRDPDFHDGAPGAVAELASLAQAARNALGRGDVTRAAERGVLAEQRLHPRQRPERRGRPHAPSIERAELAVALGGTAVDLAGRLLDEMGADDEQLRFLETAGEFQARAEAALGEGALARAIHLAGLAEWSALKAVVLPGGVTDEEARAMLDLATDLFAQAEAAVGTDPTDVQRWLLERARRLLEAGAEKVAQGQTRGVGALWQAAVISSFLLGG